MLNSLLGRRKDGKHSLFLGRDSKRLLHFFPVTPVYIALDDHRHVQVACCSRLRAVRFTSISCFT